MDIRAIIVDDEERSIIALQQLIEKYCTHISVISTATNITQAESLIREFQPDVVFLDIEMPGGNGFKLLERFDEIVFEIIFITAYQEHAIKAIKLSALDYLLKPVKIAELQNAVEKIIKRQSAKNTEKYHFLKDTIRQSNPFNKIILSSTEGYYPVKIEDIIFCKADDSYTHVYMQAGKHYIVSKQLKDFEEILTPHNFFRIHKSFLINLNHVEKIKKGDGINVIMTNLEELPVSVRKKDEFIDKLKSF